jgi:hypothetical protein
VITQYALSNTDWTAISAAGQSGSCWLDEDDDGAGGHVDVRIYHASAKPAVAKATEGKRCWKSNGNDDVMLISADNASDIYWAICINEGATATISADVV